MGNVKIRIGSLASTKIMAKQYEPIEVSSSIEIEREISDENVEDYIKQEQEKMDDYVIKDAKSKIRKLYKEINVRREKLLGELDE